MRSRLITFSAPQGFSLGPPARAGGSFSSMPPTPQEAAGPQGSGLCPHWPCPGPAPSQVCPSPLPLHICTGAPQLASERSTHPPDGRPPPSPPGWTKPFSASVPVFHSRPIQEQTCSFCSLQNTPDAGLSPGTPITATLSQAATTPGGHPPSSRPLPTLPSSPSASPARAATPVFSRERQCCLGPCSNHQ